MKISFLNPKPRKNPRPLTELEQRHKSLGINRVLAGIAFIFLGFQVYTMIEQKAEWYVAAIMAAITLAVGLLGLLFHRYVKMVEAEMKQAKEKEEAEKKEDDKNIWDEIEEMRSGLDETGDHPEAQEDDSPEETE